MSASKVISVVSGKGGTGKSTISAGIALSLAKLGRIVLLVDLDIGLRALDLLLGVEHKLVFDIGDVIDKRCKAADAIVKHKVYSGLQLLCSPVSITKSFNIHKVVEVISKLRRDYDYIILDLPAGLGLSVMMAKEISDEVLVVTTPDAVTIRDSRKICDVLLEKGCTDIRLLINRVSKLSMQTSGLPDLDKIIDDVAAPLLGVIRDDPWISSALKCDSDVKKASAETTNVFNAIADRIEGRYTPLIVKTV